MKKFLQFAAVAAVAFVFTSCADNSVEGTTKGYLEELEQYKVEKEELTIDFYEEVFDFYEYLEDLDKKDLRKSKKNRDKWFNEIHKEYEDEIRDLERQKKKIEKEAYRVWGDEIMSRLIEAEENEE